MSALAMILVAGIVMGDGPGKASGRTERGLDLRGEWEGTYGVKGGKASNVKLKGRVLAIETERRGLTAICHIQFADDGHGKLRVGWAGKPPRDPGTYKVGKDSIVLTFPDGGKEMILSLKRVKPAK